MQEEKVQRRGKPGQLEKINPNTNAWMFNQRCLELFFILKEGTHAFHYCSRKGQSLSLQEKEKRDRMMDVSDLLGIHTYPDKAIVLYLKPEHTLSQPYNQELIDGLSVQLKKFNAEELLQLSYMLDEQFIQELTTILFYIGQQVLPLLILNQFHNNNPASYYQVVKNAYLHHVKQNEDYMPFREFLTSNEAQIQVESFIDRIRYLLIQNGQ